MNRAKVTSSRYRLTPAAPDKPTENSVEACLKSYLLSHGWYPIRLQSGLFRTLDRRYIRIGIPGLPDYVVIHSRCPAFFLETKRPGGALSSEQSRTRWALECAYGLPVCVADSLEDLTGWMQQRGL